MEPQNFKETVQRLLAAREDKLSQNKLATRVYRKEVDGTSPDMFKSAMGGRRRPTIALMEAVAEVLGVGPEIFGEYRLALARKQMDEREVGLSQALTNLEALETAMQTQPHRAADRASVPEEANSQPRRAAGRATRNRKAG